MKTNITNPEAKYSQLSFNEREEIAILYAKELILRQIAQKLNRSPSTISREIRRNAPQTNHYPYIALAAQKRSTSRKIKSHKRLRISNLVLKRFIRWLITQRLYSPEIITHRLRKLYPHRKIPSHETIYPWIYHDAKELIPYLTFAHRKRRKRSLSTKKGLLYLIEPLSPNVPLKLMTEVSLVI